MTWNDFASAPQDGTPILISDRSKSGPFSASVRYQTYDPETARISGQDGYWCYCDDVLNDVCPQGPETPFVWLPDPSAKARA
jgi:hypothetical protein